MNPIDLYLEKLAVVGREARRQALQMVLEAEHLEYIIQRQETTEKTPQPVQNYLLLPEEERSYPLFCAHYDAVAESTGANDNAAALCILIALAQSCKQNGIVAGFAFFDAEEDKHKGAKFFLSEYDEIPFKSIINLDVCGFGEVLTVHSKGSTRAKNIQAFCAKEQLEKYNGRLVKFLPESDDKVFSSHRQPVLSIAMMPMNDLAYLNALACYNESILGKPPEYYMMLEQMEVYSTMHGEYRDSIEWVDQEAMQKVYDYLLDCLTTQKPQRKRFGIF